MNAIVRNIFDVGYFDALAVGDSSLHRLDPRAKLLTTLVFIVTVVSFDRYATSALVPFVIYPVVLISVGSLSARRILGKVLLVSPFAILVGMFNPLVDQQIIGHIGSVGISGGWLSLFSIFLRFFLTVTASLLLVALTGFNAVCAALLRLGLPRIFVTQLLFFYRYIFVLGEEAGRMVRAHALRSGEGKEMSLAVFGSLAGLLLLRTLERAERIHAAMCCRGFDGEIRLVHPMRLRLVDMLFFVGWTAVFILLRNVDVAFLLGRLVTGGAS